MASDTAKLRELESERQKRKGNATPATTKPPVADIPWKDGDCNTFVAYILFFVGGFAGLHHLYLDRPIQAALWLCSPGLGGFFGFGCFRDFFMIPGYVSVRNASPAAAEVLSVEMKYHKVPPWRFSRVFAAYTFGNWFSAVGYCLGTPGLPEQWFLVTKALAGGLGVWLAGTACTHQGGSLKLTLALAVVGVWYGWSVWLAVIAFQWTRYWQPEVTKWRPGKFKVVMAVLLFWSAAGYGMVQFAEITVNTNAGPKTFGLKEGLFNILKGINLDDVKGSFNDDEEFDFNKFNWGGFWNKLQNGLDASGERNALRTLGMDEFVGKKYTQADVKSHYRTMAKEFHPDRVLTGSKKEAEEKMQEINGAKGVLDGILGV